VRFLFDSFLVKPVPQSIDALQLRLTVFTPCCETALNCNVYYIYIHTNEFDRFWFICGRYSIIIVAWTEKLRRTFEENDENRKTNDSCVPRDNRPRQTSPENSLLIDSSMSLEANLLYSENTCLKCW